MVSNESHEVGENESSAYLGRSGQRTSASRVSKGDSVHFVKEGRREREMRFYSSAKFGWEFIFRLRSEALFIYFYYFWFPKSTWPVCCDDVSLLLLPCPQLILCSAGKLLVNMQIASYSRFPSLDVVGA